MIAGDTSAIINFLEGKETPGARLIELASIGELLVLPPPVVLELVSSPHLREADREVVRALPMLDLKDGFFVRAGELRRSLLVARRRARSVDCMIAQCCIDHRVSLITDDADFQSFVKRGLRLASAQR